jgi:membrane protease YdiL (CAAX protease family)
MSPSDPTPGEPPSKPPLWRRIIRHPLTRLILSMILTGLLSAIGFKLFQGARHGMLSAHTAWAGLKPELIMAVAASAAMLLVGRFVEKSSLAGMGFGPGGGRELPAGFVAGATLLSFVVGVMALLGWYRMAQRPMPIASGALGREFFGAVLLFLLVGIFEEVFFRGIVFRLLEQWLGTWIAVALNAALFGWVHHNNPGATWASTVGIAIEAGVLLAATFVVTRNLWAAIGMHWAWNLFEGPVWGTPVSGMDLPPLVYARVHGPELWTGGAFGPEAGLVCVLAGGAVGIWLMVVATRRGKIVTPRWLGRLLGTEKRAANLPSAAQPES